MELESLDTTTEQIANTTESGELPSNAEKISSRVTVEAEILSTTYGIDEENLDTIVENAKDFAIHKGIAMRPAELPACARVTLPFCIVPSHFPLKWFEMAREIQPHMNFVLHKIASSKKFLKECLLSTIKSDEFTANIYKIFEKVEEEGKSQPLSLGLIRSDYLLNCDSSGQIIGMKQVENNTIASSFGGISPRIHELHMFVLDRLGMKGFECLLPVNEAVHELAKGIVSAWDAYENQSAVVLFVVENITLNICDQRALEYAIWEFENRIEVLRCTFAELHTCTALKNKRLYVKEKEVAVVYYRCGYVPDHYEPQDWELRLLIERSHAIKCPSAALQLAGTKKVQVQLTRPGVLEMFVHDKNIAEAMREVFAVQYSLDMNEEGNKAVSLGIENPNRFVMKPEREGGGNNIYGNEVKTLLEIIGSTEERQAYVLMERINPPAMPNCIVQSSAPPIITSVVSELGIFGVILADDENIWVNNEAGHLLRSKEMDANESGIAAGFGALDSPYFT